MTDDELDALLTPKVPAPDPAARAALLARTAQELRRPLRLWPRLTAAAALFAAGVGVGWFVRPLPPPEVRYEVVTVAAEVPAPAPVPPGPPPVLPPDAVELEAETAEPPLAAGLYRRAGDLYLKRDDVVNAARCYRLFLAEASRDARAPANDDSWLLLSMKSSSLGEGEE